MPGVTVPAVACRESTPSLIIGVPGPRLACGRVSLFTSTRCTVQVRIDQVAGGGGDAEMLTSALAGIPGADVDVSAVGAADYRKRVDLPGEVFLALPARVALVDGLLHAASPARATLQADGVPADPA